MHPASSWFASNGRKIISAFASMINFLFQSVSSPQIHTDFTFVFVRKYYSDLVVRPGPDPMYALLPYIAKNDAI